MSASVLLHPTTELGIFSRSFHSCCRLPSFLRMPDGIQRQGEQVSPRLEQLPPEPCGPSHRRHSVAWHGTSPVLGSSNPGFRALTTAGSPLLHLPFAHLLHCLLSLGDPITTHTCLWGHVSHSTGPPHRGLPVSSPSVCHFHSVHSLAVVSSGNT